MRCLADVPADLLMVACAGCRRRGVYDLGRLIAAHGAACELKAFLATMRASCAHSPCAARLLVPMHLDVDRTVYPGNTFSVELWASETTREMHVGDIAPFDLAEAAFDRAVALWPHSTVTIRHKAQIMRAYRPEEERARAVQERIFRNLGLR